MVEDKEYNLWGDNGVLPCTPQGRKIGLNCYFRFELNLKFRPQGLTWQPPAVSLSVFAIDAAVDVRIRSLHAVACKYANTNPVYDFLFIIINIIIIIFFSAASTMPAG